MAVRERFLRHVCVVAVALGVLALVPRGSAHFPTSGLSIPVAADADVVQSGASMERSLLAPGIIERPAQTIIVHPGDTLEQLAIAFHADAAAIRWANGIPDVGEPAPGTTLLIPPGRGALVEVLPGERPSHLAARLGIDPRTLLDYNALHSDTSLPGGSYLQVPRVDATRGMLESDEVVPARPGVPSIPRVPSTQMARGPNPEFPWGQCTYYVATRRMVTWSGNAGVWYIAARRAGRPEGLVPVQGAIAVFATGWLGHVAYVERVNTDGSFVVSEWNVRGLGVWDERTLTVRGSALVGFIY